MGKAVFLLPFLLTGCFARVDDTPAQPGKPPSACAAFGEAPYVTTIRQPPAQPQPHPDCVELEDLSATGQRQFCCMGPAFDAWYAGLQPAKPLPACEHYVGVSAQVSEKVPAGCRQ
jgi:hypothetical protein